MVTSSSSNHHQEAAAHPEILSLNEFNVAIPQDVYDHLSKQYASLNNDDGDNSNNSDNSEDNSTVDASGNTTGDDSTFTAE